MADFEIHYEVMGDTQVVSVTNAKDAQNALDEAMDLLGAPLNGVDEGQHYIRIIAV